MWIRWGVNMWNGGVRSTFILLLTLFVSAILLSCTSGLDGDTEHGSNAGDGQIDPARKPFLSKAAEGEWEIFLDYNWPQEGAGSDSFFDADMGIHNQSYHFDGIHHYSAGTDKGRPIPIGVASDGAILESATIPNGWVFINDDTQEHRLLCKSNLGNPFLNPVADGLVPVRAIHTGGGYFHDGRMYSVISNSPEGSDTGLFTIASYALDPDCSEGSCECDVQWIDGDGNATDDPTRAHIYVVEPLNILIKSMSTYYGLVNKMNINGEDRAVVYSNSGKRPWICSMTGMDCVEAADSVSELKRIWPQECFTAGQYQLCTPYPGVLPSGMGNVAARIQNMMATPVLALGGGAGNLYVFESVAGEGDQFVSLLAKVDIGGDERDGADNGVMHASRSEGVALHAGQIYLATHFDYEPSETNVPERCVGMPCTTEDGRQRVVIFDIHHAE